MFWSFKIADNADNTATGQSIGLHRDAVDAHHRFENVQIDGMPLDLSHLEAFALRLDPGLGFEVDVVVLFSCHCFTHSILADHRAETEIPGAEIFDNGRERRVLDIERYHLSTQHLVSIVRDLHQRTIQVAGADAPNFMTFEFIDADQVTKTYAVFFEVEKDSRRKRRLLLRIQSAYILDDLTQRQKKAGKVRFSVLLKAAYEGRRIRG